MAVEISTIRTRIKGRLDTITNLTNYTEEPEAIPKLPFTIVGEATIDFNTDFGGGRDYNFRVLLAVAERGHQEGWTELDNYLASSGTKSIKAALEDTSEAAPVAGDYTHVKRIENVGWFRYRDRTFLGAEFIVYCPSGG